MFAIAGVTFAYTSCTDYSEDINKVDNRVDNVEGRLTTVEGQVKNLETTTTQLKDAQAKTDAAVKTLETTLKELQTEHGDDVKNINDAIKALQGDMKALKERADEVDALIPTLATKKDLEEASKKTAEEIAKVNEALGALQGNLETAQKAITALEGRVSTLEGDVAGLKTAVEKAQKAADAAQTAADKAQSDATLALGNIEALKKALGKYAEKGALESKIALLEKMDSTLQADKFDTKDFGTFFAKELKDVIGAYAEKGVLEAKLDALDGKDEDLQDQITKLDAKVEQYNTALNDRITKLDEKVEQYKAELDARIDAVLGIIADRLSSIALVPQYYYDGVPAILFETIAYDPLADDKENVEAAAPSHIGDQNSRLVNQFKNYTSAESVAQFRLNPRTVGVDCADFSLVGDKADYVFTRAAAPAAPVSIVGTPSYDPKTGYATFKVKKNEKINTDKNENKNLDIVALKAVLKKGLTDAEKEADAKPEVYSEFVHVNEIAYTADQLAISDKAKLAGKKADHEYAKTFTEATKNAYVYKMPYDAPFDLKALVATCINSEIFTGGLENVIDHANLDLEKYDLHYEFSVAQSKYDVTSAGTTTNQQTVIKCVDRLGGIFKVMDANGVEYNQEAIGRTPIVRVDLMHGENIVTRAFIKLVISVDKAYDNISIMDNQKEFVVKCPDTKETMTYNVEKLRKDLYRVLNISHVDFWNLYDFDKAYVKKDGKDFAAFPAPKLVDGIADDGKATKDVYWEFTHGQVGKIGNGAKVEGYLVLKNKLDLYSKYPTTVTFKFTADFRLPVVGKEIKVTADIKDIFWKTSGDNSVLQANVNVPASETDVAANCYFQTPIAEQPWDKLSVTGLPCGEIPMFRIAKVYMDGKEYKAPVSGIYLAPSTVPGEENISLYKDKSVMKALNSELGLQALIEWYAVGKSGDEYVLHTFMVNFIRPVNLNFPDDIHVKDAKTGGDEITYGFAGLLTDWRGETILPPTPIEIHEEGYHWVKVCSPADHAVVFPGYQKVVKEGYYEFEFEDKEVVIPTATAYHKASIKLYDNADLQGWYARHGDQDRAFEWVGVFPKLVWRPAGTWVEKTTVVGYGRSEAEALENAKVEANKLSPRYLENVETRGWKSDAPVTEVLNSGTVTVTFKTIKNVTYVPAVTETVEPKIEYSPCNPKPGPSSDVYTEGQRIGCWQWQKWATVTPGMTPGRFWDFYGVFKPADDVVLDLTKVTTDLPDGKLPSKATLTQKPGYKLFYDNVLSPIQYTYHIYIPASIEYGWGVLNQTLVITVDPYNK
jgi:predicted  nucleic acid-binding Zn-ribbon protein